MQQIQRQTWEAFHATGLLGVINQILPNFGWCIAFEFDEKNALKEVYPATTQARSFIPDKEERDKLINYIKSNIDQL